jgi:hypothetical protein
MSAPGHRACRRDRSRVLSRTMPVTRHRPARQHAVGSRALGLGIPLRVTRWRTWPCPDASQAGAWPSPRRGSRPVAGMEPLHGALPRAARAPAASANGARVRAWTSGQGGNGLSRRRDDACRESGAVSATPGKRVLAGAACWLAGTTVGQAGARLGGHLSCPARWGRSVDHAELHFDRADADVDADAGGFRLQVHLHALLVLDPHAAAADDRAQSGHALGVGAGEIL